MIENILIYSLETAMIFSLMFIPYLFIKNDTFFTRNRFYLLFSLVVSLIFPLINFDVEIANPEKPIAIILEQVNISSQSRVISNEISILSLFGWLFIFTGLFFFCRLFFSIFKIVRMINLFPTEKNQSETIVWLKNGGDFSFFHYIFLSKEKISSLYTRT